MTDALKISPRRLDQLKAIGKTLNLTAAATVSYMIRKEIAAGTIPAGVPGISVNRVDVGVTIQFDQGEVKTFSLSGAGRFAETIRGVIEGIEGPRTINKDFEFEVAKRGSGINIGLSWPGVLVSFTPDLALDIADMIAAAIVE